MRPVHSSLRDWRLAVREAAVLAFFAALVTLCACSTVTPSSTLEAERKERQRTYATDCRRHPENYGYPYSGEELMRITQSLEISTPVYELVTYCSNVARILAGYPVF